MPANEHRVAGIPRLQLTFEEACSATSTPVSTMELMERRGQAPLFYKVGRRKYTTPELIAEWQAKRIALAKEEAEADGLASQKDNLGGA